ncbi:MULTISPECIES: AraC family transcriptional regulator [Serratia]|uniref:Helix-turn-helix transcriptional regulator n=2 Tax=Serratia proteamaculans TaxID=28151 RepID=A0A1W5DIP4_SERPR|nr:MULTISPECIES: AraC family transcriptional regulator [Serratia]MBO1503631.1 helix-turn-helix transcriptional regulator [Serratia proteamaculans]MDW5512225.1 AraC family transcriptional regulator [Serratia proteamaculans]QQX55654.1 helix-turn-helix transcriptional regulator [Serratia proteamaculans]SMB34057.1 putative DNA-binding transcriptional regulator [Serratia proteamaculans]
MKHPLATLLAPLLNDVQGIRQVYFAGNQQPAPELAYQVDFPRLEMVIEGEQEMAWEGGQGIQQQLLLPGDVLFVPAQGWNSPRWQRPVTTLSLLFGKQQLGYSLVGWDGENTRPLGKDNVARRGPRVGSFMLQALNELAWRQSDQATARFLTKGLLSHALDLFGSSVKTASRSQALFDAVRCHLEEHYREPLTRESVAQAFYISSNYLSHLFQKTGGVGFNEYLNHVRLEQAKHLLKRYDMKVKEVAHACGFVDSNYFCRLFRKNTERSPSEYRGQYHSELKARDEAD